MFDAADFNPIGSRRRRTFHEEEIASCTVRISLHHHCPVFEVGKKDRGNVDVVLNQVSFGNSQLRPKQFVEVREFNHTTVQFNFEARFVPGQLDSRNLGSSFTTWVFASTNNGRMVFASGNLDHFGLKISDFRLASTPLLLL